MKRPLVLLGATGRMGGEVKRLLAERPYDLELVGEPNRAQEVTYPFGAVVIDFSLPDYCLSQIENHQGRMLYWIIGSTGWTADQNQRLQKLAKKEWILRATNFSWAVQALAQALKDMQAKLGSLDFKCSITEVHHTRKLDAPSGTAKTLAESWEPSQPIESIRVGDGVGIHEIRLESREEILSFRH